jgi:hypothetical protein
MDTGLIPGKEQNFTMTSPGTHIGFGRRTEPKDFCRNWMVGEGDHKVTRDADENIAPKYSFGTSTRQDKKIPNFPGPAEKNVDIKNYGIGKSTGVKLEPHTLGKNNTKLNDPSATLG